MKSKDKLIQTIIKARFGKHNDAKKYEPVSTDVLFLLKSPYKDSSGNVAMSDDGFIFYGYVMGAYYDIVECKTLNEDGSPIKIKDWIDKDCDKILESVEKYFSA